MSVLGSTFGVMVNVVFSDYVVFICMIIVLLFSFYKTLDKGLQLRKTELGLTDRFLSNLVEQLRTSIEKINQEAVDKLEKENKIEELSTDIAMDPLGRNQPRVREKHVAQKKQSSSSSDSVNFEIDAVELEDSDGDMVRCL